RPISAPPRSCACSPRGSTRDSADASAARSGDDRRMPESRAELIRSRARVVAAGDETRRRIQRELHDGAQQRLVQAIITLKIARTDPSPELIDEALEQAERAMSDLRELVQGIMPAILTRGGLRSAVEALRDRAPVPVDAEVDEGRMPALVETTAYFAIAEAVA